MEFVAEAPRNTNQPLLIQGFYSVASCVPQESHRRRVWLFLKFKKKREKNHVSHNTLKSILVKGQMMPSISFYRSPLSFYWYVYSEGNALCPLTLPTINNSLRSRDNRDIKKNICIASDLGGKPKDISDTIMGKGENNSSCALRGPTCPFGSVLGSCSRCGWVH